MIDGYIKTINQNYMEWTYTGNLAARVSDPRGSDGTKELTHERKQLTARRGSVVIKIRLVLFERNELNPHLYARHGLPARSSFRIQISLSSFIPFH